MSDTNDDDDKARVAPIQRDFLFVKPGARWLKFRQKTVWDRQRIGRLALVYSKKSCDSEKRALVEQFVHLVWRQGGRFLRGQETENENVHYWAIVTDQNVIVRDVMCILRQTRNRLDLKERTLTQKVGQVAQTLQRLKVVISDIQSMVVEDQAGQTGTVLTLEKARRVGKLVDAMDKAAAACCECLIGQQQQQQQQQEKT